MQYKNGTETTILSIGSPSYQPEQIHLRSQTTTQQSTEAAKRNPENTLGKYCAVTEGVVEVRNLSKFPASATAAAATFTSGAAAVVAVDATDGFDEVVDEESSDRLSTSTDAATAPAPGGGGGAFCLADRGDGDGDSDGDGDADRNRCCSCCCWRRTWGGL